MKKNKILYNSLIATFITLYVLVAYVSFFHAITFFKITNELWLSVFLSIGFEVGQASVLFAILLSENKNRLLSWVTMCMLTAVQIAANIFSAFKFMDQSGLNDWSFFQRSILFWVQTDTPEMYKIIISYIQGGILPLVALFMTALVAQNLKLAKDDQDTTEQSKSNAETEIKKAPLFDLDFFKKKSNHVEETNPNTVSDAEYESTQTMPEKELIQDIVKEEVKEDKPQTINNDTIKIDKEEVKPVRIKKLKKTTPSNKIRGWHLLNEFVDNDFNVFNKGTFIGNDKSKKPTQSKKA
jgi:hypothetical protein